MTIRSVKPVLEGDGNRRDEVRWEIYVEHKYLPRTLGFNIMKLYGTLFLL